MVILKRKNRITDNDLNNAYAEGIKRKMPVILLTNGELTKKAKKNVKEFGDMLQIMRISV